MDTIQQQTGINGTAVPVTSDEIDAAMAKEVEAHFYARNVMEDLGVPRFSPSESPSYWQGMDLSGHLEHARMVLLAVHERHQAALEGASKGEGPSTTLGDTVALENLRRSYSNKCAELVQFKDLVRETALEVKAENSWCDEGFNRVMDTLGLERISSDYEVTLSGSFTWTTTVTAEDADSAGDQAIDDFTFDELRYESPDDLEVVEVSEA